MVLLAYLILLLIPCQALAGPYPPEAGHPDSTAVWKEDPSLVAWAAGWDDYTPGPEVSSTFQTPDKALGPAAGDTFDVVSLGRGGTITLRFTNPIRNGEGWDFAVFENAFRDDFLELAYVEVSSDGVHFIRFDSASMTPEAVGAYGLLDPTDIDGLAGKYRQGYGTPFDLERLAGNEDVAAGRVDLARITRVRVVDVVGDGSCLDSTGRVIYDPYPTTGSAGFDLDAVGIRYTAGPPLTLAIKAGGQDDLLQVPSEAPVSVTLHLRPGDLAGMQADWVLAVHTPFPPPDDWLVMLFQYPLLDLDGFEILNGPLPAGGYTFFFAVDRPADGALQAPWWDKVDVKVD